MLYREIKPRTVLIVDDEPANISLLNEVLKTDYLIMVAKDGKEPCWWHSRTRLRI